MGDVSAFRQEPQMVNRVSTLFEVGEGFWNLPVKRADLHCHSNASNEADEAVLNAIGCPESYSEPLDVYAQAKRRKMDWVTITDHDSLNGVEKISSYEDTLSGEELTCYFPEDRCKIHLLLWGLTAGDHVALQAVADDIYKVAAKVESRNLAHSVAHPVYRQNDKLEKWHLERLILLFKGFETLNGAHSVLHRQALEPLLDALTPDSMIDLALSHGITARWDQPHLKSRTGGSDDHGLFNIGRTWTEFPGDVVSVNDILDCLRTGRCRPGGEAGSSLKLAHNFYGVGIRYYQSRIAAGGRSLHGLMLRALVGETRSVSKRQWVAAVVVSKIKKLTRRLSLRREPQPTGSKLLLKLFLESSGRRFGENGVLGETLRAGGAALGEHQAMFDLMSNVNRDIADGLASAVAGSKSRGELTGIFDAVSSVVAHQFLLLPYYFALFHQNRERQLLPRVTGHGRSGGMKLGVFTDTFDEVNGVSRFIADMSRTARAAGRDLIVHTSTAKPTVDCASRKNFTPLVTRELPGYADQSLTLPPLLEILEWADRQQFDAIHVHTPGPMGLCGLMVAMMLRVPVLGTYHTDFPRYVQDLTGDHRLTVGTSAYMKWFYGRLKTTFCRSRDYRSGLNEMGLTEDKLAMTTPGVDTDLFSPAKRDLFIWSKLRVQTPVRLLYVGRVSKEKNLAFLADTFKLLCSQRDDVSLVIAGDGPYADEMKKSLAGLPVHFLGWQNDGSLPTLYASADMLLFPSETDTLGQVVLEAQASGLPVLVSDQGGPKDITDDGLTGRVLPTTEPSVWAEVIHDLLNDAPKLLRMSRIAPTRMARYSLTSLLDGFWEVHERAAVRPILSEGVLTEVEG